MKIKLEELQSVSELDEETLNSLGANIKINGIEIPPPTTAVLSLLEIIESPFALGFDEVSDVKLRHINEVLYVLKYREEAVDDLFDLIRFDKMAQKSPEYFEKYLKSLNYGKFQKKVYKFAESLGVFNQHQVISDIQTYLSLCFNAYAMLPEDKTKAEKKKEILTRNG